MRVDLESLPHGWTYELLDRLAARASGHTPDAKKREYWNGGIKWVSLSDSASLDRGYITRTEKEISQLGIDNSSATLLPAGTVIVTRDAAVGRSAVLAEPMAVSQHFVAWRCDEKKALHNWYLYYWLQFMKTEFERQAVGSTIKTIGLPYFRKLRVAHPEMREQKRIAEILRASDETVQVAEKLVACTHRQKRALARHLLHRTSIKRSVGKRPGRLKIKNISERVQRQSDGAIYPVAMISSAAGFVLQDSKYSRFMAGKSLQDYTLLHRGEFAYNKGNSSRFQFGCVFRLQEFECALVPNVYVCFRLNPDLHAPYYAHLFESDYLKAQLGGRVNTGVRNNGLLNIKPSDFLDLSVPVPAIEEQREVAQILTEVTEQVDALQKYLQLLKRQRSGLLQGLITGARRVKLESAA